MTSELLKQGTKNVSTFLDFMSPVVETVDQYIGPLMTKAVSWSDPTTVIITLFIILSPFALIYVSFMRVAMVKLQQMVIEKKNILFVIAHPDHEARFFQPSILELGAYNKIYLLCLSNGNEGGLGRKREKELELSCKRLGFTEAPTIIDDPELQEGVDKQWAPGLIADYIMKHCKQKENLDGDNGKINMIVTYD